VVDADGTVVLLGAPLSALTLIHYAERVATLEPKRWVSYEMPVRQDGETIWRRFHTIDTSNGAYDYRSVLGDADYIEVIAGSALRVGIGRRALILGAVCHFFPARRLVDYAATWIDTHLGSVSERSLR
jgi:aminoglycoside 3-N-acetyltransferase